MWDCKEVSSLRDPLSEEIERLCRSQGVDERGGLPRIVEESWERCLRDYNLLPDCVPRATILTCSEVQSLRESCQELLRVAKPEVESLFQQLIDGECVVSLASPQGVMLLFRSDYRCLGNMSEPGGLPGSVWTEERQERNGVGTCLRLGKSVAIVGNQHYGTATKPFTCLTAPVFGALGAVESVINVTTPRSEDLRMKRLVQSMVERSARRIENGYFRRMHRHTMQLRLLASADSADCADEGRLALDDSGRIIAGTSLVGSIMGASTESLIGAVVDDIFDLEFLLHDMRPEEPIRLTFQNKTVQAVLTVPEFRVGRRSPQREPAWPTPQTAAPAVVHSRASKMAEKAFRTDPTISQALDRAQRLLKVDLPLIIVGETGSGKTVFAKTLASRCFGADAHLIIVDCTAPDIAQTVAAALSACGVDGSSCIILECFDEADTEIQNCLLKFLENDRCLGSGRPGIIATSAREPDQIKTDGRIRSDLLYRLKGGLISLQPLRNNPDMDSTIRDLLKIEQDTLGKSGLNLDVGARLILVNYHWPGNLRELRKALRHAIALAEGPTIGIEHLPHDIVGEIARKDLTARSQFEASRIEAALRYNRGNVSLTARYLGVSRATLYRKIAIHEMRDAARAATD